MLGFAPAGRSPFGERTSETVRRLPEQVKESTPAEWERGAAAPGSGSGHTFASVDRRARNGPSSTTCHPSQDRRSSYPALAPPAN